MTKSFLRFFVAVVASAALHASAQTPAPPPPPVQAPAPDAKEISLLDGNYVLTLSPADKDKAPAILVIVARPEFNVEHANPHVRFSGKLLPQSDGHYLVDFVLVSGEGFATSSTNSSVLLRLGEPAQIVKNSEQFYNLRLDRYNAATTAKTGGSDASPGPGVGFMR